MNYTLRTEHFLKALVLTLVVSLPVSMALAQPPAGGGGRGGFGGGGGGGRGQGRMFGRQMTVLNVPIEALQAGLKLTADQKTKIAKIQEENRPRFGGGGGGGRGPGGPPGGGAPGGGGGGRGPGGPPGGGPGGGGGRGGGFGGGGGGQRPDFQAMQARSDAAVKSIEALLTPAQKKAVPALVKEVGDLRTVGIPVQLYGDLSLTGDQKSKIGTLAKQTQDAMQKQFQSAGNGGRPDFQAFQKMREDTSKKALAFLNAGQKAKVEKYLKDNPPRGFGGFGGGGGRGGGFGGGRGPGGPPGGNPGGAPGGRGGRS